MRLGALGGAPGTQRGRHGERSGRSWGALDFSNHRFVALRYGLAGALALCLGAPEVRAQSTSTFRGATPFPGTVRDLLRDDLAKTSGQLYGAIGTMERRGVLHMQPGEVIAVAETNIIGGALRIPGTSAYGAIGDGSYRSQYQLLPADVFALSATFAVRWEKVGLFASAGGVYPRVSDGTEALVGRMMFPLVGLLATPVAHLGVMAAPFLTGSTQVVGGQTSADIASYVYGGFYDAGPVVLYAGLVGTGRGSGLYTNISQNRLKLLTEAVLSEQFSELSYLKFGLNQLPDARKLLSGELPPEQKKHKDDESGRRSLTSFYGRKVQFSIPRRGADAVALEPGRLGFWSAHAEQANIGSILDVGLALGVAPSPILHEARVGLHTRGFHGLRDAGVGVSLGAVQLPALYMLGQQPGLRMALRIEARLGEVARVAIYRNEPETLSAFPYAYDAWSYYFSASPLMFFDK